MNNYSDYPARYQKLMDVVDSAGFDYAPFLSISPGHAKVLIAAMNQTILSLIDEPELSDSDLKSLFTEIVSVGNAMINGVN